MFIHSNHIDIFILEVTSKKTYILNFGIGCVHVLIFDVKINIYLSERQRQKDREIERQTERHAEKEKDRQRQTKRTY